jgi:uncharacterized Zn finger protein
MKDDETRENYFQSKPRKVKDGFTFENTSEEKNWWAKKWINEIETFEAGNRFKQGRYFAKQGQVVYVKIQKGFVIAKVQDAKLKPHVVKIEMEKIPDTIWVEVMEELVGKASYVAKLYSNDLYEGINDIFKKYDVSLLPEVRGGDLKAACNCSDWANPCKHTAAVLYILGELFDKDPFLFFKLRGKNKEEVLTIIEEKQQSSREEEIIFVTKSKKKISNREIMNQIEQDNIEEESISLLEKLGSSPFESNNENFAKLLDNAYKVASELARKQLEGNQ